MNNPDHAPKAHSWPARIQNLIDGGRLHAVESTPARVAVLWSKAVESAKDAELPGMSIDGALRAAYDAGHLATLALLAAHGLRTGSGHGHHELAFSAAAALDPGTLGDIVADSAEIRGLRKGSMYDPMMAGGDDRDRAVAWMRDTLPAIRAAIVRQNPKLADRMPRFP